MIAAARFTEQDIDAATAGLCGMFALALYRACIDQNPTLILLGATRDNQPLSSRQGGLIWRHAVVEIAGRLFDIEGEQQQSWLFGNYAWDYPKETTPILIPLTVAAFITEMRGTKSAWDWRHYTGWRKKLIDSSVPMQ